MMYLGNNAVALTNSIPSFANLAKVEIGTYTPTQDEDTATTAISHSLGEVPNVLVFFADEITPSASDTSKYIVLAVKTKYNVTTANYRGYVTIVFTNPGATTTSRIVGTDNSTNNFTTTQFYVSAATDHKLKANTTYHYLIGKIREGGDSNA